MHCILSAREGGIEPDPQLEQRGNFAANLDTARSGTRYAGDQFQQGALTGPVFTNNPQCLARLERQINVLEHPVQVMMHPQPKPFRSAPPLTGIQPITLAHTCQPQGACRQS